MLTHLYRLGGAALVLTAVACGGAPEDFEGADNTHEQATQEGACARLRTCCLQLADDAQGTCLAGATSQSETECTASLEGQSCR